MSSTKTIYLLNTPLDAYVFGQCPCRQEIQKAVNSYHTHFLFQDKLSTFELPEYLPALEYLLSHADRELRIGLWADLKDVPSAPTLLRLCLRLKRLWTRLVPPDPPMLFLCTDASASPRIEAKFTADIIHSTLPENTQVFYAVAGKPLVNLYSDEILETDTAPQFQPLITPYAHERLL